MVRATNALLSAGPEKDRVVPGESLPHCLGMALPETGASLNVSKQKGQGLGRRFSSRQAFARPSPKDTPGVSCADGAGGFELASRDSARHPNRLRPRGRFELPLDKGQADLPQ